MPSKPSDYDRAANATAESVIKAFSTSFSSASRTFPSTYKQDIYNIYALVRIADEIVDTYLGADKAVRLEELKAETYRAIKTGYSTNLVVHAFAQTAQHYDIGKTLIEPFFESMRMDLEPKSYHSDQYDLYIHGSAEVVGLMCLKVFCEGDGKLYEHLRPGAEALGAAFQKVNFLRDLRADYEQLGRYYFPVGSYDSFSDETRDQIVADIRTDFAEALPAVQQLPVGARGPVLAAYRYYQTLLGTLANTPARTIKIKRIRVNNQKKGWILATTLTRNKLKRR